MKLSIITINYNNAEGLRKTLASVASQTYAEIEHIIVDGGSTDGSVDVIREYESFLASHLSPLASRLKWLSEKDSGIYNAMNKGLEIVLGRRIVNEDHTSCLIASSPHPLIASDYIQILNSGDMLAAPDVTERMMAALAQQNEKIHNQQSEQLGNQQLKQLDDQQLKQSSDDIVNIVENDIDGIVENKKSDLPAIFYGNMIKEYPNNGKRVVDKCLGDRNSSTASVREIEWTMYDFIKGTINHNPTYIHRSLYEKYGLYDDNLKIVSDWKWFVNVIVFGGEKVFYTPIDVTIFDMTGISETNLIERENERTGQLKKMLPATILKDYNEYLFPIFQYNHLQRYHLWSIVYFVERVLFKLEKWKIIKI